MRFFDIFPGAFDRKRITGSMLQVRGGLYREEPARPEIKNLPTVSWGSFRLTYLRRRLLRIDAPFRRRCAGDPQRGEALSRNSPARNAALIGSGGAIAGGFCRAYKPTRTHRAQRYHSARVSRGRLPVAG